MTVPVILGRAGCSSVPLFAPLILAPHPESFRLKSSYILCENLAKTWDSRLGSVPRIFHHRLHPPKASQSTLPSHKRSTRPPKRRKLPPHPPLELLPDSSHAGSFARTNSGSRKIQAHPSHRFLERILGQESRHPVASWILR